MSALRDVPAIASCSKRLLPQNIRNDRFLGEAALAVASEISYKFHPYRFAGGFDADSRFAELADQESVTTALPKKGAERQV